MNIADLGPWLQANQKPILILGTIILVGTWGYVIKKRGFNFINPTDFVSKLRNLVRRPTFKRRSGISAQLSLAPGFLDPSQQVDISPQTLELRDENRRLQGRLVEYELEKIRSDIIRDTEGIVTEALPTEQHLVSGNGLVGRPVYYLGGVPVIDIEKEAQRISSEKRLSVSMVKRLYFNGGHPGQTLYFYGVTMLSNGKWAVYALSKPPKLEIPRVGSVPKFRLPFLTETYVLTTAAQDGLDNVFVNKLETLQQGAAVILSSTVHGPVPLSVYRRATAQASPEALLNLKPNPEQTGDLKKLLEQVEAL